MTHPAISRLEPWFSRGLEALTSIREVLRRGPLRSSPPPKGGSGTPPLRGGLGGGEAPP